MRHDTEDEHTPAPPTSTTRSVTATADRSDGNGFEPFTDDERSDTRRRWTDIETRFVDDPAGAASAADELLEETTDRVTRRWQDHRAELRDGWDADDASTEQLRMTLKRYRASLERLLSR